MNQDEINEIKIRRGKSIVAMGLVKREDNMFYVSTPSLRGKQVTYKVWRNDKGKVVCDCLEFESEFPSNPNFRCEHILAIKFYLEAKNQETNAEAVSTEKEAQNVLNEQKTAFQGYSIGAKTFDETVNIQFTQHSTFYPYVIQVNKSCPNQKEIAQKIVDFLNRELNQNISQPNKIEFPANPIAVSLMDLITARQLGMIRAIGREMNIDENKECCTVLSCEPDELSKKAASAFIIHLQNLERHYAENKQI